MKPRSVSLVHLAVICLAYLAVAEAKKELVFVQAIWRHGDRAPNSHPYPKDPYDESAWPRGWKQLTNRGINQLNELGRYFRRIYNSFISPHYVPSEVYIRSSDSDRALTSAQAFLSGFYPATGSFQWQKGNAWQPIPVHSATPGEDDPLLKPTSTECKKYDELVEHDQKKEAKKYDLIYGKMFNLLEKETGIANFSFININKICNVERELINNLTAKQPWWVFKRWAEYGGRSTLEIAADLCRIRRISEFNSERKAKLMGGYLLNNWIENAKMVANGTMKKPKKMLLYSSHDGTILALMHAMGVENNQLVPYASALIMEIYKDGNDYLAKLFYRNDTAQHPYQLYIPGCGKSCPIEKMVKKYQKMVLSSVEERQNKCGTPTKETEKPALVLYYLIVLSHQGFLNERRYIENVKRLMNWRHPEFTRFLQYHHCWDLEGCLKYPTFRKNLLSEISTEFMNDKQLQRWLHSLERRMLDDVDFEEDDDYEDKNDKKWHHYE